MWGGGGGGRGRRFVNLSWKKRGGGVGDLLFPTQLRLVV